MRTLLLRSANGGSHPHHNDEGRRRSIPSSNRTGTCKLIHAPTTLRHTMSDTYILNVRIIHSKDDEKNYTS